MCQYLRARLPRVLGDGDANGGEPTLDEAGDTYFWGRAWTSNFWVWVDGGQAYNWVSPSTSTEESLAATRCISAAARCMLGCSPTMRGNPKRRA